MSVQINEKVLTLEELAENIEKGVRDFSSIKVVKDDKADYEKQHTRLKSYLDSIKELDKDPLIFKGASLRYINLANLKMPYSDFSGANLEGVSFQICDLRNSRFNYADVSGANFYLANLENSDLVNIRGFSRIMNYSPLIKNRINAITGTIFRDTKMNLADLCFAVYSGFLVKAGYDIQVLPNHESKVILNLPTGSYSFIIENGREIERSLCHYRLMKSRGLTDDKILESHLIERNNMLLNLKKVLSCAKSKSLYSNA